LAEGGSEEEEDDKENAADQDDNDEDADPGASPAKRRRRSSARASARAELAAWKARRRLLDAYRLRGSWWGTPSPLVLLKLAEVMNVRITNQLLW
jgi:hypothetical protein